MNALKAHLDAGQAEVKTGKIDAACARYSLGRTSMRKVAEQAGAVVHIGKSYLINFTIMDRFFDDMSE